MQYSQLFGKLYISKIFSDWLGQNSWLIGSELKSGANKFWYILNWKTPRQHICPTHHVGHHPIAYAEFWNVF